MGVYPFVVPFRPLAGTLATDVDRRRAPPCAVVHDVTGRVADALRGGRHARRRPGGRLRRLRRLLRPVLRRGLMTRDLTTDVVLVGRPRILHRHAPRVRSPRRASASWSSRPTSAPTVRGVPPRCAREVFVARAGPVRRPRPRRRRRRPAHASCWSPGCRTATVLGGVRLHPARRPDGATSAGGGAAGSSSPPAARTGRGRRVPRWSAPPAPWPRTAGALRFDATVQQRQRGALPAARLACAATDVDAARAPARGDGLADRPGPAAGRRDQGAARRPARRAGREPVGGGGAGFVGDDGAPVPGLRPGRGLRRDPALDGRARPRVGGLVRGAGQPQRPLRHGRRPGRPARRRRGPGRRFARGSCAGCGDAAQAWGVPVLGGHTQLGVPGLAVGHRARSDRPTRFPGGGGPARRRAPAHRRPRRVAGVPATPAASGTPPRTAPAHELRRLAGVVPATGPDRRQGRQHERAGRHDRDARRGQRLPGRARRRRRARPRRGGHRRLADLLPGLRHGHRRAVRGVGATTPPGFLTSRTCGRADRAAPGSACAGPTGVVTEAIDSTVTGLGAA